MKREVRPTSDNSKTLYIEALNESYHSHHGALQEAEHVFIKNGIKNVNKCEINILELGFGTGLNLLVTFNHFLENDGLKKINYYTIEKYPVSEKEIEELNYPSLFNDPILEEIYKKSHQASWETGVEIYPGFFLYKFKEDFFNLSRLTIPKVDLVYFDCFGARVQPDLWEEEFLKIVTDQMEDQSLLTTYASKGSVRRIFEKFGLKVKKKPGPPGKREMMNAWKI